ncbi:39S ribosomal protein L55, mitochondrial [Armadillidium nasatum]|uniref:39S ribosomal protein L55, mitochondrial n=1 Tax=Armadillidium nasatum TaxID=96803 RepID=A0A5N5SQZ7_9CRUS|nr:39S ribosomal protein L55, mitochondrial [Armadillidium nasatum]
MYPTHLIFSDGSSILIRYQEPRKIIKLPLDISALTEEERIRRLYNRKPKTKVIIQEDIEDSFDVGNFSYAWSKLSESSTQSIWNFNEAWRKKPFLTKPPMSCELTPAPPIENNTQNLQFSLFSIAEYTNQGKRFSQ